MEALPPAPPPAATRRLTSAIRGPGGGGGGGEVGMGVRLGGKEVSFASQDTCCEVGWAGTCHTCINKKRTGIFHTCGDNGVDWYLSHL